MPHVIIRHLGAATLDLMGLSAILLCLCMERILALHSYVSHGILHLVPFPLNMRYQKRFLSCEDLPEDI